MHLFPLVTEGCMQNFITQVKTPLFIFFKKNAIPFLMGKFLFKFLAVSYNCGHFSKFRSNFLPFQTIPYNFIFLQTSQSKKNVIKCLAISDNLGHFSFFSKNNCTPPPQNFETLAQPFSRRI
jgi:hypothetical protein